MSIHIRLSIANVLFNCLDILGGICELQRLPLSEQVEPEEDISTSSTAIQRGGIGGKNGRRVPPAKPTPSVPIANRPNNPAAGPRRGTATLSITLSY